MCRRYDSGRPEDPLAWDLSQEAYEARLAQHAESQRSMDRAVAVVSVVSAFGVLALAGLVVVALCEVGTVLAESGVVG